MFKSITTALAALALVACGSTGGTQKLDAKSYTHYAKGVHDGEVLDVNAILADPTAYEGKTVRVRGDIVKVCPKKGCWVTIGSNNHPLFAKFEQCDKYLPLDLKGPLVVEGQVEVKDVSVAEQKHLLEDQGKVAEAAAVSAPKKEVRLVAQGAASPL